MTGPRAVNELGGPVIPGILEQHFWEIMIRYMDNIFRDMICLLKHRVTYYVIDAATIAKPFIVLLKVGHTSVNLI